jgi:hypothetical protein
MMSAPESPDFDRARVLSADLGAYHSRVILIPSRTGRTLCFGLAGEASTDPGAAYCFQPKGSGLPAQVASRHFAAMALFSALNNDPRVQLFGIAFDDVRSLRIQVAGQWHDVSLANNAFYFDLPGVESDAIGTLEATLTDGSRQTRDMASGN